MRIKLPRIDKKDQVGDFPDMFNQTITKLETKLNEVDIKLNETTENISRMNKRLDNFYSKIIEIFGIFIAIFALILITGNNISVAKGSNMTETVLNAFYLLTPLTVILIIFVVLLNWLRKR